MKITSQTTSNHEQNENRLEDHTAIIFPNKNNKF